jgi:DNA-binding SARP family transcriptional activator
MAWLNPRSSIYIDLAEFMARIAKPSPSGCMRLCEIYRGELLESLRPAGEGFEEWLTFQRTALRTKFIAAVSHAIEIDTDLTPYERHYCANRLLQIDPYHEGAHRALMFEAAATGQFSSVRRLFNACSKQLREDLGVGPDEKTVRLYHELISSKVHDHP